MKTILVIIAAMGMSGTAFAGNGMCKDAKIKITNTGVVDAKVIDIKYWDSSAKLWRDEHGASNSVVAAHGATITYTSDLEEVKNDPKVKVKIEYKVSKDGKWKNKTWSSPSSAKKCKSKSNTTYKVTIRPS